MSSKMGHVGSKTRSLGQILEKILLINAIPHNLESSGERLQHHHGPLVIRNVIVEFIPIWFMGYNEIDPYE